MQHNLQHNLRKYKNKVEEIFIRDTNTRLDTSFNPIKYLHLLRL